MPKILRLRAQVVGWISWELTGSDMALGLRHDDLSAEDDQPIGGHCKTGLDWRVILGVLATCWIF
jgi:hypothetical protein